jgi:methyl-accepting chemotaxis protein
MKNYWNSLGIVIKLNIPIQILLVAALSFAHFWVMEHIKNELLDGARRRAIVSADGVINGMNMLMVTGKISDPDNRRLYIKKMSATDDVKELRIIRAKQVQDQFGMGLPEEQARDDMDRRAITSKQDQFLLTQNKNAPTLRAVIPFIASKDFRGTNCLACHHVKVGSVNGAASITIDLTKDYKAIDRTRDLLWVGQITLQILLFLSISWLIRRFMMPIKKLQSAMESMQRSGSLEMFTPVALKGGQDEVGELTGTFNQMS